MMYATVVLRFNLPVDFLVGRKLESGDGGVMAKVPAHIKTPETEAHLPLAIKSKIYSSSYSPNFSLIALLNLLSQWLTAVFFHEL